MAEMLLENPNWNKDMIDWLIDGKLMVRKMRKLKAYLRPILTTFCPIFFRAHAGKTEKNTSQQQFSVLSTSHSDT